MPTMTKEEIIRSACDAAYKAACEFLTKHGMKFDNGSTDCIFVDDTDKKKTHAINIFEHECEEYEGE